MRAPGKALPALHVLHTAAMPFPSHQGSQVYIAGLTEALAQRGHRVRLLTFGDGSAPAGVERIAGYEIRSANRLRSGLSWQRLPNDLLLLACLRRQLAIHPPQLIHAHNVEAPVLARIARSHNVPIIYDQHTQMEHELTDHLGSQRAGRILGRWVDKLARTSATAGVALSTAGAHQLARMRGPVETLPPGFWPTEMNGSAARGRANFDLGSHRWLVYTGNLDAYQDLGDLVAATDHLDEPHILLVTGDDPSHLVARLEAAGATVRAIRSRTFQDSLDALTAGSVAVIPRRQCSGFPIKLLNHMGCGIPTVATTGAVDALGGVVRVAPAAPTSLAAGIRRALGEEHSLRQDVLRTAKSLAWPDRAEAMERFYHRVVG